MFDRPIYRQASTGGEARYNERGGIRTERVLIPRPAPPSLRISIEIGREDEAGFWAHIAELDVSGEGDTAPEAFGAVLNAARAWLAYLGDEEPPLAENLEAQRKYVALLDAPIFSWFKSFELSS